MIALFHEFARWKSAANAHKSSARALRPRLRVGGGGVIQVVGAGAGEKRGEKRVEVEGSVGGKRT